MGKGETDNLDLYDPSRFQVVKPMVKDDFVGYWKEFVGYWLLFAGYWKEFVG